MCEITSDNFDSKFQEISYNLHKANFIAIDSEFTGLHIDGTKHSLGDTADQRYKKVKQSVQTFNVIQIGLCTFRYCSDQRIYITDAYNFYLFPRNYGLNGENNTCFQSSAIDFLCKYDFDFNKLTYKGISYMNSKQEKQLESKLKKQIFFSGIERDIDEKLIQNICSEVTDWLLHANVGDCFELSEIKNLQDFIIHKELRNRFDSIWTQQENSTIIVEKISKERRDELNISDKENEIKKIIDLLLGFTKIFRLLIEHKKPLIFHNGFMDLMFLYEKFYEPLPDTVGEFKTKVNELFPLVYDTKHISIEMRKFTREIKDMFDGTVLDNLFNSLNREIPKKCGPYQPLLKHSPSSSAYLLKSRPHEAGYDAFMTGSIFLNLAHAMTYFQGSEDCQNIRAYNMNDYFSILKPLENRIRLIKASVNYINLNGKDPKPLKLKTFLIKNKYASIDLCDLIKELSSIGDSEVVKISKNSAHVTVDSYASERLGKCLKRNNQYEYSEVVENDSLMSRSTQVAGLGLIATGVLLAYSLKKFI